MRLLWLAAAFSLFSEMSEIKENESEMKEANILRKLSDIKIGF